MLAADEVFLTDPHLDDEDPMSYPCDECGADAGEECTPLCTGLAAYTEGRPR